MTELRGSHRWLLAALGLGVAALWLLVRDRDLAPAAVAKHGLDAVTNASPVETAPAAASSDVSADPARLAVSAADAAPGSRDDMLRVRVVDTDGHAIDGAFVGLSTEGNEDPDDWGQLLPAGRSDARGELCIRSTLDLPRFVAAWQPNVGHSRFMVLRGQRDLTIAIERMDRLVEGVVVEHDGSPARGAIRVRLGQPSRHRGGRVGPWTSQPGRVVRAEANGHFAIAACSRWGECWIAAQDERRACRSASVDLAAAGTPTLRLTMPGVCGMHGLVLDAKGTAVAGSVVLVIPCLPNGQTDAVSYSGVSANDGSYRVALYDAGEYEVTALGTAELPFSRPQKLAVGAVEQAWLPRSLCEAGDIIGVVVPAPGATLVKAFHVEQSGASREAKVRADGAFTLRGLQHGEQYVLLAFAGDDKVGEARSIAGSAERAVIQATRPVPANERR